MNSKPLKIVIADDHNLVLDGLASMLRESRQFEVIATASNGQELVNILEVLSADIVMTDIDMPIMNGIEATAAIRAKYPDIRILALSMHQEAGMIRKMTEAGANGYVLKNIGMDELVEALTRLSEGKSYFSSDVTSALLSNNDSEAHKSNGIELTTREEEILTLISEGFSNTEIGEKLFISPRTVDTHRNNIMKKTGSNSIAALVKYAIRHGYTG